MSIVYLRQGNIATFVINRPDEKNALDLDTLSEFYKALIDFRDSQDLWVGIITGAGNEAFSSGLDLSNILSNSVNQISSPAMPATLMRGLEIYKPIIAAINGLALGGGLELALACDIRIAASHAIFGLPEVTRGLIPGWGGTQRLPRIISGCHAAELILTGKTINSDEAYRIGLVNRVVSQDVLIATAEQWANLLCNAAPLAVRAAKEAMIKGSALTLDEGLEIEDALVAYLKSTDDFREGLRAFMAKRKPFFQAC